MAVDPPGSPATALWDQNTERTLDTMHLTADSLVLIGSANFSAAAGERWTVLLEHADSGQTWAFPTEGVSSGDLIIDLLSDDAFGIRSRFDVDPTFDVAIVDREVDGVLVGDRRYDPGYLTVSVKKVQRAGDQRHGRERRAGRRRLVIRRRHAGDPAVRKRHGARGDRQHRRHV